MPQIIWQLREVLQSLNCAMVGPLHKGGTCGPDVRAEADVSNDYWLLRGDMDMLSGGPGVSVSDSRSTVGA